MAVHRAVVYNGCMQRVSDDGKHIAVGDASGRVTMYTVADRVALPRAKEVERFVIVFFWSYGPNATVCC